MKIVLSRSRRKSDYRGREKKTVVSPGEKRSCPRNTKTTQKRRKKKKRGDPGEKKDDPPKEKRGL